MKKQLLTALAVLPGILAINQSACAQETPPPAAPVMRTPAATEAEKEAFYAQAIENRVGDIVKALNLSDADKAHAVHDILVHQYHELRVRDAEIDTRLMVDGKEVNFANRQEQFAIKSKPLHEDFLAKLNAVLTPDQVEQVKDLMTYNKVKVTFNAYCQIVPNLTDADKAKIMELLKAAREEAVDGGNAPEKSAIFQKYKDQINQYLDSDGHDTAKAFKDWAEKHPNPNTPVATK